MFTTLEFAKKTGCTPRTVRYYEEIGILKKIHRDRNCHRRYTERDLYLVKLTKRATKFLRMNLAEVKELLTYFNQDPTEKTVIIQSISVLKNHIQKIEIQKKELKKTKSILSKEIRRLESLLEEKGN